MIIFFAAISLGFKYSSDIQIDQPVWVNALIRFNLAKSKHVYKIPLNSSGITIRNGKLVEKVNDSGLNTPQDTTTSLDTNSIKKDSLSKNPNDTLVTKQKVDSMAIDSTARLKYLGYKPKVLPYVTFKQQQISPLFLTPSPQYQTRVVELDSTGKNVNIIEKVAGEKSKIILTMPLEEYINMQMALEEQQDWQDLGHKYVLKNGGQGLQQVIKDITNFEIPLPSVGLLTIFGKPRIRLRIAGAVDIHGAWQSQTTQGVTASLLGNTRNEPDFSQQVQINVDGTIGDKLNINADWNTQRQFDYQNQLKIKYTGYEDEIIQSIEAGNVSLQTTPLVGGSEALFGVKAKFQLGPLDVTALASQQKGQTKTITVNGGSQSQTFDLRAYQYATNNYFLDTLYSSSSPGLNLFEKYYSSSGTSIDSRYTVVQLEVWKSYDNIGGDRSKIRYANAYMNLDPHGPNQTYKDINENNLRKSIQPVPGESETHRFILLKAGQDYTLHPETGWITFNSQLNNNDIIAVAFRIQGAGGTDTNTCYGEFLSAANKLPPSDSVLVLKLVKPSNLLPQYKEAWSLQLKNIYSVGGLGINRNGFSLDIKYEKPGQDAVSGIGDTKFLHAFGFDNVNANGSPPPDGQFDWNPNITILPNAGEIIFPTLQPFGKDLPSGVPDSLSYPDVYDTLSAFAQQNTNQDKWDITGQYSGSVTSTYQLGFNLVQNSVHVYLNGNELQPNVDYTIDYNVGQLTILDNDALVPGANLKITYEQNDLFSLASKTLLGARAVLNLSDKTKLGFSILNLNQQTLNDKVRIGEEPLSNTMMGTDFNTSGDLPFLTRALDHLISTKQMSTFTLGGEFAYMNPNPNTKTSTITSDKGQSIAYIDDFEGAKEIIPIGVSYTSWKDLSAPGKLTNIVNPATVPLDSTVAQEMMKYKAHTFWFNVTPSPVTVTQIWGTEKQVSQQNQSESVLDFVYVPDTPGTYNGHPQLKDLKKNWGGMMKALSSSATNLIEQNVNYIEFWMKIDTQNFPAPPDTAKLYIDLGRISEDVIPNNKLDTEDKNNNGILDPKYDLGIDGRNDDQERAYYHTNEADPAHDNFAFNAGSGSKNIWDYFSINGTQGNGQLYDNGKIPDTEDLNNNGSLDVINSYFRYAVPLDTNAKENKFIAGRGGVGSNHEWHLFRIPLSDTSLTVGDPSLATVQYIRVFVTGLTQDLHLSFAEFNLTGNQWQSATPKDTTMRVSVINIEDNSNTYYLPPGLQRAHDNTQPNQNVLLNEQSMNLIFHGLKKGESREAIKNLYSPLDVFNYKQMKLFVHGDLDPIPGNLSYSSPSTGKYSAYVYFKFGTDSTNYYEYQEPLVPDWQEISITFSDLTRLKEIRGDTVTGVISEAVPGEPGHFYKVRGQPTLTAVKYLVVGVYNINDNGSFDPGSLSGDVWVDELRVIGADNTPGWAYTASTSLQLADLMGINFNINQRSPQFHSLSNRFGNRVLSKNWSFSTSLNVLKLLPVKLDGSNFKINYSHSESVGRPQYLPGTDIQVNAAAALAEQQATDSTSGTQLTAAQIRNQVETISTSDVLSTSGVQLKIPSSYWLINDTWNNLSFSFNYNKNFSRSPTVLSNKSWNWNFSMNYGLNFSPNNFIYPAKLPFIGSILRLFSDYRSVKVYFTPQNFSFNMSANRYRTINVNRAIGNTAQQSDTSRDFSAQRGFSYNWKLTDGGLLNLTTGYNVHINSSLLYLETNAEGKQRSSSAVFNDIFSGAFFGKDNQYSQSFNLKASPVLPSLWDLDKYFSLNGSYSVSYQWRDNLTQGDLGVAAGYSSSTNLSMVLRLKALTDPLFANLNSKPNEESSNIVNNRAAEEAARQREIGKVNNTQKPNEVKNEPAKSASADTSMMKEPTKKKHPLKNLALFFESLVHYTLFDYENININFSNSNSLSKSGLRYANTGFDNFWGLKLNYSKGPSRAFMLGLGNDVGPRAPGAILQDVYSQTNDLSLSTSRTLWTGATININWDVNWTLNKNTSLQSDENGNVSINNITSTGTISRSFLTFPPFLFFSFLKTGVSRVHQLDPNAQDLSDAFVKGFEVFPVLSKLGPFSQLANYIPRPNWTFTWSGLQSIPFFHGFAKNVSLTHAYSSTYTEGWMTTVDGTKEVQSQRIQYGFNPLIGLSITFKELWGGNLVGSAKYSTTTSYDLGLSTDNITQTYTKSIGITAGYSKSGFDLPIFGISLKNDIQFNLSYSLDQNSSVLFDMVNFSDNGIPQNGTTRTTIEPSIKYTISSKVTMSIFYTRTSVQPEGASTIPPTVTNTAGLDVHISIQ